jgi:Rrf2 family transcriptional regulator, cysteine metabolism repressor
VKLSTRTRYGMRALVDLTINGTGRPVQLKDIAARQKISLSYLEHLVIPLISAGLVQSIRGAHGGVRLALPADQITLNEIIEVLEGPIFPVDCLKGTQSCPRSGLCATQDVWGELKQAMEGVLKSRTLKDLAENQKAKDGDMPVMYYI